MPRSPEQRCLAAIERILRKYRCVLVPEVHVKGTQVQISVAVAQRQIADDQQA